MGFSVGLHTNGMFPSVLEDLIDRHLVEMIALDIKTTWERYDNLLGVATVDAVKESLAICRQAKADGSLGSCQAVVTLFRAAKAISRRSLSYSRAGSRAPAGGGRGV